MGRNLGTGGGWDNTPISTVTLTGFWMGKYQVTQERWQAVMTGNTNGISATPSYFSDSPAAGEAQNRRPVESVSWYYAIVFCNRLSITEGLTPAYSISGSTNPDSWGAVPHYDWNTNTVVGDRGPWDVVEIVVGSTGYRLPTEAQWEYACRAGTTTAYNTGNSITSSQANYNVGSTTAVGSYAPNAWGLYDMHGNVWDWCWDWHGNYTDVSKPDPAGAVSGYSRVIRGGSWSNVASVLRSAHRQDGWPVSGFNDVGFRLVRP